MIKEEPLASLIERFKNTYNITESETEYISKFTLVNEASASEVDNDSIISMLVEEVDFFLKQYKESANRFRFYNDLLNKDRARVIRDQLYLLHQFFEFLLSEVLNKSSVFCDENSLILLFEATQKMEDTVDKYAKFVFQ